MTILRYVGPAVVVGLIVGGSAAFSAGQQARPASRPATAAAPAAPARAAPGETRLPGYNPDRNAYYGDLHVHTYLSNDAYIFNLRRTPDDAYRFAKGEVIGHSSGYPVRLKGGPLDFVAVTDHAEYLSVVREAGKEDSPLHDLEFSKGLFSPDPDEIQKAFLRMGAARRAGTLPKEFNDPGIISRAWREVQDAAARNNQPGRFTTFVGYEYTSAPDGRNLHRNVIFRGANVPGAPYSASESADPDGRLADQGD